MAETYEHAGQKVTTNYKKTGTPVASCLNVSTSYMPTTSKSTEEKLEAHADRRAQNREIRDGSAARRSTGESGAIKEYDSAPAKGKSPSKSNPLNPRGNAPPAAARQSSPKKKPGGGPFAAIAQGFGEMGNLARALPAPTWINDGKKGKGKGVPGVPMGNLPDWVMTGRSPWSGSPAPVAQNTVVKTIITKVHADGTKTRSTRAPSQKKAAPKKPNWIRY